MKRVYHLLVTAVAVLGAVTALAVEPLHRQSPFDEVKLDETNSSVVLKVKPLQLPERKVPALANRRGDLELELLERPGEKFSVAWANVVDVRLFEDRVLAEAEQLAAAGKFDEAQSSFRYLEEKYPQLAGLAPAVENFLWLQIGGSYRSGRYDEALALLVELHRRNPNRTGLAVAYERTTIELVKAHLAAKNYRAARGLLATLGKRFPATGPAAIAPYHSQLQQQAQQLLTQAQAAAAAEKWSAANQLCQQALEVWPAIAGGSSLSQQIHVRYPAVTVGVIASPAAAVTNPQAASPLTDWHSRRLQRLLATPLVELSDSEKGPAYRSPYGKLVPQADPRQFVLQLSPGSSAPELARRIVLTGTAATAVKGVRARGLSDLLFQFDQPQWRAPAWLRVSLREDTALAADENGPRYGQFTADLTTAAESSYRRRAEITAAPAAPQLVHERKFPEATPALAALRRGQIHALERVPPWELGRLKSMSEVRLLPYAIPTVHLLIPNASKPLTASRTFRRGLLLAIDRESILKQGLLADQPAQGCAVLSGPFPKGSERLPWSYANDSELQPRSYDPSLASVLLEIGRTEAGLAQPAPLLLVHDDQPTAKVACQSIARQLGRLGQPVTLQQLPSGQAAAGADLQYVELAVQEPLVDSWAIVGPGGLAGSCSPLMLEYFRALETAPDMPAATARLHAIHRLAAAELPVLPLWQTTNFAACHASLQGLAERPVSLYEDVLNWQIAWRAPQE